VRWNRALAPTEGYKDNSKAANRAKGFWPLLAGKTEALKLSSSQPMSSRNEDDIGEEGARLWPKL